jgi:hypothetical protein
MKKDFKIQYRPAKRVGDKTDPAVELTERYKRHLPEFDYLKYWRPIKYWAQRKYSINGAELDCLMFLYSEMYFDREKFEEFNNILPWDRKRFDRMMADGWIHTWREKGPRQRPLYEITERGRRAMNTVYKKLNREEISERFETSPIFYKTDASYSDKIYRNFIKKMNRQIRQERYLSREQQKKGPQK